MRRSMPPSLELTNLERLPPDFRKLATSLLELHPPPRNVSLFADMTRKQQLKNYDHFLELLPVLYRLLDPSRLPEQEELDSPTKNVLQNITLAHGALWAILSFHVPPGVRVDFWPRIWAWVNFYFAYEDYLSGVIELNPPQAFYSGFMILCAALSRDPDLKKLVLGSTGAALLAVRVWTIFTKPEECFEFDGAVYEMIHAFVTSSPELLYEKVVEEIDGGISEVARLVMLACEALDASLDAKHVWVFAAALDIVLFIDGIAHVWQSGTPLCRLCDALLPLGFVKSVVIAGQKLCALAEKDTVTDGLQLIVGNCLLIIEALCQGASGHRVLRTAVQHGLLRLIVASAAWTSRPEEVDVPLRRIVADLLTPCTVFYYLLLDLEKANRQLKNLFDLTAWPQPEIARIWSGFTDALETRLDYLERYNSGTCPTSCANTECGKTSELEKLKWCSGCRSVLYCNKTCQSAHWRAGHRISCLRHQNIGPRRRNNSSMFTNKEYGFLQFLRYEDHRRMESQIARDQVLVWADNPNAVPVAVLDYATFPVTLTMSDGTPHPQSSASSFNSTNLDLSTMRLRLGVNSDFDIQYTIVREDTRMVDGLKNVAGRLDSILAENLQDEIDCILKSGRRYN
ncbi:hypothetical protein R3P38DRAFT_619269 [Favolaschia claudopus]|uniref:phytol kinase n=1 Tax=Favolaschia claudopus TaxID=2862362 RepID=A0AAW0CBB7_9AGAR